MKVRARELKKGDLINLSQSIKSSAMPLYFGIKTGIVEVLSVSVNSHIKTMKIQTKHGWSNEISQARIVEKVSREEAPQSALEVSSKFNGKSID